MSLLIKTSVTVSVLFSKRAGDDRIVYCRLWTSIGEIYSGQLRDMADGDAIRDDCQTILRLWESSGKDPVQLLNGLDGKFAFVLYDEIDKTFLVGRDRYGIKPVYIGETLSPLSATTLWVSSTLHALPDDAINNRELPAGHYFIIRNNKISQQQEHRWAPPTWRFCSNGFSFCGQHQLEEAKSSVRSALEAAVQKRMRHIDAHLDVGVCLSGDGHMQQPYACIQFQ
jgi:asparagine synthase (glutamine-hydrolysing)